MKKKKVLNKSKLFRFILLSIVILLSLLIAFMIIYEYKKSKENNKSVTVVEVKESIDDYGYTLKDTATDYYKDLFSKLKTTLSSDSIDEKEYASILSQMFVTDFYTLSNKMTSSDIGGVEFVAADYQDNFKSAAQNSIYKSVKSNIYGDRTQELPTVTKASIDSLDVTSYSYDNTKDKNAYNVKVSITYASDLGYPTSVKLILIHNNNKLEVAKVS